MDKMALRDHFAGLAMQQMVNDKSLDLEEMCETAYEIADAMLEAREKKQG